MSHQSKSRLRVVLHLAVTLMTLFAATISYAQVTSGNLAGTVTTRDDGAALPGVTVEAVHVPTGTRYSAVTTESGRFNMPNVRVGGPYTVSATLDGFSASQKTGLQVRLGTTTDVPLGLALSSVSEAITVTAAAPVIDTTRAGSSSQVSEQQIEALPTVNRSIQDFARTNPYFTVDASDGSSTRISVAGRSNRYNNIQIDGAVNNDLFGLADTGTPGGQTDAQPISLDAIEQIQLVVSPFDVRQGGFTGGGINAVTRSGANTFDGSLFYSQRNNDLVGDGPFDRPIANFDSEQYGGRFGGPIFRDRLFFFLTGEVNKRTQPTDVSADGSTGTVYTAPGGADAARLRDTLITRYQYDPGTLGDFPGTTDSNLAFLRFDFNVNSRNNLTLRHNYVDALRDVIGDRSTTRFRFPTAIYTIADETNSTVAQLNTVFGASSFNEARLGFQTIRDARTTPVIFPTIEIGGTGSRNGALHAGTERFSGANELDQDVLEITDDFTFIAGNHNVTVGTHNEIFEFKNLFLSEFYGYYYFPTLADFEAGRAREYRISFSNIGDARNAPSFEVGQYGLYVNDLWRVSNKLSLTMGIRGDLPSFGDTPARNPLVETAIGFSTAQTPSEDIVISPRIGFNWDITGGGKSQLRGGAGIFAGRTPYVWVSNAYNGTGVASSALSCIAPACTPPAFNPDPFSQPRNLGAGGAVTVDIIDPDFEFPRILRTTLGYDQELFWGIRGTIEGVYSKTQEDVFYLNVNRVQNGVSSLDGRPTYARRSTQLADALLLTNTQEGSELVSTLQFSKQIGTAWQFTATYANQDAKSAFDSTSSRAVSNFQFRHTSGDIFKDDTARSAFEIEDRLTASVSYNVSTGPLNHVIGLFYNAQSGRPYSILTAGDPNTDGFATNDLLFIPAANGAIFQTSTGTVTTADRFVAYIKRAGGSGTEGRVTERYEYNEPGSRQMDFHYELGLPISAVETRVTADVQNVLNLVDKEYGVVRFVSNQNVTPVSYRGIDAATGKPIYRESFAGALDPGRQFSTADSRSRWVARVGVRVNF